MKPKSEELKGRGKTERYSLNRKTFGLPKQKRSNSRVSERYYQKGLQETKQKVLEILEKHRIERCIKDRILLNQEEKEIEKL